MDDAYKLPSINSRSGKFLDIFRFFHPTRTNAFTCWSTVTGARQTNYGTRIDYIFADCQLAKDQFVAADIMPEVEGSDHCPVWGQLSCSLVSSPKPPPFCTQFLPEFAGKQQKLSRFLIKMDQKSLQLEQKKSLPGSTVCIVFKWTALVLPKKVCIWKPAYVFHPVDYYKPFILSPYTTDFGINSTSSHTYLSVVTH